MTQPIVTSVESNTGGASTAGCYHNITRWNHTGKYICGEPQAAYDVDWNADGRYDETFVIAPNREIWHTWANAGGWKELPPGNGFADYFSDFENLPRGQRCVEVYVRGDGEYVNVFRDGKWRGWSVHTCV
ncbi:hypothetical protein ABZZ74_47865 [Streptomyces sp. NPDC006476]|uniref:hypothetical protein n=1 Tax=Streptomyces sp. NPDC006476 TaxID=3157175 RepID=UPI0033A34CFA